MRKLIPCVFIGCVLISLMAGALPASAESPEQSVVDYLEGLGLDVTFVYYGYAYYENHDGLHRVDCAPGDDFALVVMKTEENVTLSFDWGSRFIEGVLALQAAYPESTWFRVAIFQDANGDGVPDGPYKNLLGEGISFKYENLRLCGSKYDEFPRSWWANANNYVSRKITLPPSPEIIGPEVTNSSAVTVSWTGIGDQYLVIIPEYLSEDPVPCSYVYREPDVSLVWVDGTTCTFSGLHEGTHTIELRALDKTRMLWSHDTSFTFTIDLTPPTARIIGPSDSSYLESVVDITVAGDDTNFERMELYTDNSVEQTWTTGGTQTCGWDTTTYTEGEHSLKLIVYDAAGNIAETSVMVIVNNIPDDDEDGIPDEWELAYGLNPNDPSDALLDFDGDGLNNLEEYLLGTDPTNPDSDGDGLGDGVEIKLDLNPVSWDTDGDGIGDGVEFAINFENCEAEPLPDNYIKVQVFWADYRMDVVSNSTVLGVTFDSDSGQLTVGVSGPDGTTGTCDITVPKALISSTSDVSVYLDDQPIEFTLTQDETNYHIHIEYAHSEHDLVVSLTPRGATPPPTALILVIALIVVMGVLCAYFIRKKLLG